MDQHYFNIQTLTSVMGRQADPGETLLGIVFTPGFDRDGKATVFAFPRVKNNATLKIHVKEDTALAGCPYPPPCDPPPPPPPGDSPMDCYSGE